MIDLAEAANEAAEEAAAANAATEAANAAAEAANAAAANAAAETAATAANAAAEAAEAASAAAAEAARAEAASGGRFRLWLRRFLDRRRNHPTDFDYRLQGLEKKLDGFFLAINILALLVAVGLLASVSNAWDRIQIVMEDSIATNVNDEIDSYINEMYASGTEIAKVKDNV